MTLRLPNIPVTRVENFCATGTEAFRGACYAVASGAVDIALALGVEKLKDTGYGGLPRAAAAALTFSSGRTARRRATSPSSPPPTAPSTASTGDLKRAIAHVSLKSHENGAKNPKAHLQNRITEDDVLNAPMIAEPLGLFDCCGVSDGCGVRHRHHAGDRAQLGKKDIVAVKALQLAVSNGQECSTTRGTAATSPPRASPPSGPTTRPASRTRAAGLDDRGARLLLDHRAGDDGGPAHLGGGQGARRRAGRLLRRRRAGCPARSTAA